MAHIKSRKHPTVRRTGCSAAVAMAFIALPAVVHAQQTADVLPTVEVQGTVENYKADTVSSPKFTQPLVDTPQTISVIKSEILQQQGATSLTEALRNTPGISILLGENGNTQTGDAIFMRGFDTSGSIFVDGIRDLGSISRDTFNIEQVEVVKGPSGSDNGRGASSGYINMASKSAQLEDFNYGSLTVGTENRQRATVDLNRKLDSGIPGSAFRLNFVAQDYGVPGRNEVESTRVGIAPSLAFGLGTPTRTVFNYLYIDQKNTPDGGVSTYGKEGYIFRGRVNNASPFVPLGTGPAVDSSNYYGINGDHDDVKINMFTAKIEHDIAPGTTIRNTTRVGRSDQDLLVTGVSALVPADAPVGGNPENYTVGRSRQGKQQTNEIVTNQTNLTTEFDTGFVKHSLSTGVEFIYESQNTQTPVTNSTGKKANLYNPNMNDSVAAPVYRGTYVDGSTLTAAAYAFDTLKLSEQWLLSAGARLERFHTETNSANFASNTLTQNPDQSLSDNLFSWKLGAVYKPATNGSIYAGMSSSFQPPGGNNFSLSASPTNANSPTLKPQEASNIEIGTKWDLFDNRVSATAAIFRSENKNELISDGGTPEIYSQLGKRRVDGIELGLVGLITPRLNVSTGFAYMDSDIIQGTPANQGGVIVFSPKVTFTSWATYKLENGITIGGGARYVDTQARSSNTTAPTSGLSTMPAYWVADAMVAYEVTKNLTLQLNIYNMFDEDYITSLNNSGARYTPGQERNALLTANLKF